MTIRLPDDVREFLETVHGETGIPMVRTIIDALRELKDRNQTRPSLWKNNIGKATCSLKASIQSQKKPR
jgi:hypothetical protein